MELADATTGATTPSCSTSLATSSSRFPSVRFSRSGAGVARRGGRPLPPSRSAAIRTCSATSPPCPPARSFATGTRSSARTSAAARSSATSQRRFLDPLRQEDPEARAERGRRREGTPGDAEPSGRGAGSCRGRRGPGARPEAGRGPVQRTGGEGLSEIERAHGRQILDSRGNPTVEVDVPLRSGAADARRSCPARRLAGMRGRRAARRRGRSGAARPSQGRRQRQRRASGCGHGIDPPTREGLDRALIDCDGTDNKGRLGANAILGVPGRRQGRGCRRAACRCGAIRRRGRLRCPCR